MTGDAAVTTANGLAAPGTRAVLVGTGRHAPGSTLPDLPGVDTTLDDLARALRDVCGMPEERIHRVPADATADDVIGAVEEAVAEATGTVLFCYTGHGLLGPGDELHLATRATPAEDRIAHSVPYSVVKGLLGGAGGGSVVVLDCCFSGRAAAPGGLRGVYDSAFPDGSFLLTSASDFAVSYAPEGERHTLFGGRLLRLLEEGDPSGPPRLTMDHVHAFLDREFRDGPVRPHRRSEGTLGALVVAPNRAYRPDLPAAALPPADVPCPYPGMEPFRAEDHTHFFGREEATERLLDAVCDPAADGHPLVLVGASGAGKSSLLRAGLLAGLERRDGAGRPGVPWPALLLPAPGPHPLRALAERWAQATGRPADEVHRALSAGAELPAPLPGFPACRLLVVDQFEETFTRCTDPEERTRFVRLLCATGGAGPRVVLGLRADHYGSCLAHPELVRALERGQFTVPPMGEEALRAAVERPALGAGLALEGGLTDRLMADLRQDAGPDGPADEAPEATALPFLAHALRETWLRRSGAVLTLAGYQATGGIRESVATTTEALYQELDEPARRALRELLLRMIQLTASAEAVRRRVDLPDLLADRAENDRRLITDVRDRLAAARLVTADQDGTQISHEALLRAWPRLRSWIREARAELLDHQQLSEAATAWEEHARDPGYLYTGSRLERIRPWLTTEGTGARIALTATERAFAEAGVRAARIRRRRRVAYAVVAACLALLLTGVGTFAVIERGRSQQRAAMLDSKLIAGQAEAMRSSDAVAALDLSLAAYRTAHTVEARTSLLRSALSPVTLSLTGHTDKVVKLAFHKDGRVLASSSKDGTVRLWDTSDPYRPASGPVLRTGGAVAAAWRPDGRYLVGATRDALFVWDTADALHPRQVAKVPTGRDEISSGGVTFSPDGRTFAVPAHNGRVWLWDMSDPLHPVPTSVQIAEDKEGMIVGEVAYSPDGRVLAASVQDESLRLLDSSQGRTLKPLATLKDVSVFSLAFRPGTRLLAGGGKQKLRTWDTTDPAHPRDKGDSISGLANGAYASLAFRPDGRFVAAAGGSDQQVHTYEFIDGPDPDRDSDVLVGGKARSVAYQPDGRGIVVGDEAGHITLREPPPRSVPGTILDPGDAPGKAFDPSARYVVTAGVGNDKSPVQIWDVGGLRAPKQVAQLPQPWNKAMFVGQGRFLLSQNGDYTRLKLWHFEDGHLRPGHEFVVRGGAVGDEDPVEVNVDRDGTLLALRGPSEKTIGIWDIRDIDHPERVGQVPWPESGGRILVGFARPRVLVLMTPLATQLWDVRDARRPRLADTVKERPSAVFGSSSGAFLVSKEKTSSLQEPNAHIRAVADDGTARFTGSISQESWMVSTLTSDRTLATLTKAGQPMLWDLRKPQQHGTPLPGPASKMQKLHVSRERRLLVASNYEGFLGAWRVSDPDGARPGDDDEQLVLPDATQNVRVLEVSPGGDLLMETMSGSPFKAFGVKSLVVSTDFDRLTRTLCSVRRAPMPDKQWNELLPGVGYKDACE
ncbi:AAA family ATPase [Streptomyces olivoreticuli]|uniref:AAA family ATPase n=1 Tax=Streptomyces olivoreticuli TaxID=68246 RepID=UPI000E2572D3|nr:AAA family ATPase [Streptomyces olivoreticuli]